MTKGEIEGMWWERWKECGDGKEYGQTEGYISRELMTNEKMDREGNVVMWRNMNTQREGHTAIELSVQTPGRLT